MGIFHLVSWWKLFFLNRLSQAAFRFLGRMGIWKLLQCGTLGACLELGILRFALKVVLMDFRMFCLHLGLARIPKFHETKGLRNSSLFFSYQWDPLSLLWFVLLLVAGFPFFIVVSRVFQLSVILYSFRFGVYSRGSKKDPHAWLLSRKITWSYATNRSPALRRLWWFWDCYLRWSFSCWFSANSRAPQEQSFALM